MPKSKEEIIVEIENFVLEQGGDYSEFYIGITNNFERRLVENQPGIINEHLKTGRYIKDTPYYLEDCSTREVAIEIEQFYQLERKMKGYNPGAIGKTDSQFIYCFKENPGYEQKKRIKKVIREALNEAKDDKGMPTFKEFLEKKKK